MAKTYTPLRYPGGKAKLANFVKGLIATNRLWDCEYVEPYCGGAGIAIELLRGEFVSRIRINDLDPAINCFWRAVMYHTDELCGRISKVRLSVPTWRRQRAILQRVDEHSTVEVGFAAFFLNRVNRSGILRAGPIGGLDQTGAWLIDARFNRAALIETISLIAEYGERITVDSADAAEFLRRAREWAGPETLIYLDPPYVVQGKRLYRNSYTAQDHAEIAGEVAKLRCPWIVSYDSEPLIRKLYAGYRSMTYGIGYSANERTVGKEIMVFSPRLVIPPVKTPVGHQEKFWRSLAA
jgi:DNA adenine methylase